MGTHPIFESDFDCLTDFVSSQKITVTKNRAMKKPDAHTVNMPPDVRGDDSVENVSTVILTLVQALLLIREHTDRAWNLEQKKTEREEGKRMKVKERKRAEFVANVEEILARIQSQIAKGHVQEIVLAIGANICNPKEMWRFKLPPTSTACSAPAKFKRWRLLGTLPDEIHSRRASRGRIHLLVRFDEPLPTSSTVSANCTKTIILKRAFASISTCATINQWPSSLSRSPSTSKHTVRKGKFRLPNFLGTCRKLLQNRFDNSQPSFCNDWHISSWRENVPERTQA